ncbi:hypothetical protein ACHAQI_008762 [Fusarium lateritium]
MPQRPDRPLMTTANGLHKISASELNISRNQPGQRNFVPLPENSWAFTDLVSAINIGLEILESPPGRGVLIRLASELIITWGAQNQPCFRGGTTQLAGLVNHFLAVIRNDFPAILVDEIGSIDILASADRGSDEWDGEFYDYQPKGHATIRYNHSRVNDMVAASRAVDELSRGRDTSDRRAMRKKMLLRHKHFQFMFATATAHEMCHIFVGYINQNGRHARNQTPELITHLDYARYQPTDIDGSKSGESGRWFENKLFGGSIEFYYDRADDSAQPGVLHVLDSNEVAWKVKPQAILKFIEGRRQFEFPLERTGPGISRQQRAQQGIRCMGSNQAAPYHPEFLAMRARSERLPLYSVSQEELDAVPERPRIVRAVRVA